MATKDPTYPTPGKPWPVVPTEPPPVRGIVGPLEDYNKDTRSVLISLPEPPGRLRSSIVDGTE